jgi:PTS system ascorbate-specific IIB component
MKVLVSCANGAGSSLLMKMNVMKVFKKLDIPVQQIHHCSLSEGKSSATKFDVVFCPLNFLSMFKDAIDKGTLVIGLRNVMGEQEATEKIIAAGLVEKYKK